MRGIAVKRLVMSGAVCLVALAVLALPAGASAKRGDRLATKLSAVACAKQKKSIGSRAFRKRYGNPPMPACVRKTRAAARRAVAVATTECQEELADLGPAEFYEDWRSFAECVADYAAYELEPPAEDDSGEDDEPEEDDYY